MTISASAARERIYKRPFAFTPADAARHERGIARRMQGKLGTGGALPRKRFKGKSTIPERVLEQLSKRVQTAREISQVVGVHEVTVRQALRHLRAQGLAETTPCSNSQFHRWQAQEPAE